jgi:hypothetical protein
MDVPEPDPNNTNDANQQPLPPTTPLNKQSMAEELDQMERKEQRLLLNWILGVVSGLLQALTTQGACLGCLEGPLIPPAPSSVRTPAGRSLERLVAVSGTNAPAATSRAERFDDLLDQLGSMTPMGTGTRWANRVDVATLQVAEVGRGTKQMEVASVDVLVDLDHLQPDQRIALVNVTVRVGRVRQVQPGIGDKLGKWPKASEVLEALLGVCRVAHQNGWGPELLCQWLQVHRADFLAKDEVFAQPHP